MDGVPAGTYTIGAVKNGCIYSNTIGVTLVSGGTTEINLELFAEETLTLGVIAGVINSMNNENEKIPLADVRITLLNDENEVVAVTTTIDDGEFAFYDIADGRYTLQTSAEGYIRETMTVNIKEGSIVNAIMTIARDNRSYSGTVSGIIKDASGGGLSGCFVGLYRIYKDENENRKEMLVVVTKTNAAGKYMFGQVVDGEYLVKVKKIQF